MIFFLLFFFAALVEVEPTKTLLHPQESLEVRLKGQYREGETPDLFRLIETVQSQKQFGSFSLASYKILEASPGTFEMRLTLLPERLGTLIFAPGLLYLENGKSLPIPSFEVECRRIYAPLDYFPPQVFRPEEAILMDEKSNLLYKEDLAQSALLGAERATLRAKSWTLLFALLFFGMLLSAGWWLLGWYIKERKRVVTIAPRRWQEEFQKIKNSTELSQFLKEYFTKKMGRVLTSKSAQELGEIFYDNAPLGALFLQLEVAQFSGKETSEEEFMAAKNAAQKILVLCK